MQFLFLLAFLFSLSFSQENIIAGVGITVNGDPITLYEIKETQKKNKITKQKAIDLLIAEKIRDQEVKRLKIDVSDSRIEGEILDMASRSNLSKDAFLKKVKQQEGLNPKEFAKKLKEQIQTQELMRSILSTNSVGEDEMREYYNLHQDEFNMPKEVVVMRFSSTNIDSLQQAIKTPNTAIAGVERAQEKIPLDTLPAQIAQVFAATKVNQFTTVLNGGGGMYMAFLVKDKIGEELISYQQAKNFIAQKLAEKRQDKILEDYFEKIKQKAVIINLRS
ncbi:MULTISPECIES: peptidylprolyl isomerase [unclassified Helicobacter]|uniref:peptidylprolyl isomerase n=1 Tax=unclassified Helicobacter TaxID=2593540 RepID=UPI0013158395|nr:MULTISPECIES: peptidylprolyl isomerase [unclassified Helicobacter]